MPFKFIKKINLGLQLSNQNKYNSSYSLLILCLSYLFAFILSVILNIELANHISSIELMIFFAFGFFVCTVSFYVVKKAKGLLSASDFNSQIYFSALGSGTEFFVVLDNFLNVSFLDQKLTLELLQLGNNLKPNQLESIFDLLALKKELRFHLNEAIRHGNSFSTTCDVFLSKPTKVRLSFEPFFITDFDAKNKIQGSSHLKYYLIKGIKIAEENEGIDYFDKINTGYYELDEVGNITKSNDLFARTLGYSKEELIESYLSLSNFVQSNFSMNKQKADSLNKSFLNNTWQGFLTLSSKSNEMIYALISQKAFYSDTGEINRIVGFLIKLPDKTLITRAKGIEEGWIDYTWQCFFLESLDPIAIVEKNGTITHFNESFAAILNVNAAEKTFSSYFSEEGKAIVEKEIEKITLNPILQPKAIERITLQHQKKLVDVHIYKIADLKGNLYGFLTRIVDVTQQKELEDSFSHSQRMQTIGYLAGSIAHDFNNLLTAIIGFSDVLLLKHTVGDSSFVHIMQIRQSANRASNLVNRLLAFSRRQTLNPQVLNLNEFFGDFYSLIQRLVGVDIELTQEIAPDLSYIKVDPVQFEQVILNLIVNAHQAISEGGKLVLKAYNITIKDNDPFIASYIAPKGEKPVTAGEYIAITVTDNGSGIELKIIDKIFEPFFTTKQEKSGTGLGLSTVYGIVIQSGGYIYLKTQLGKGTTFLILMPKYMPKPNEVLLEKPIAQETNIKSDYFGKGLIILVEDEEAVRVFAKHVLTSKGYEVLEFSSPILALEEIKKLGAKKINLIISDVVMPGMSGPHLISEVQNIYPDIKVIFISGYGEEAFTEAYGQERNFNFLPKPFTLKDLLLKVSKVL
jgi:two-component system cell cycle sensor histidine kinase/response regulator CckA